MTKYTGSMKIQGDYMVFCVEAPDGIFTMKAIKENNRWLIVFEFVGQYGGTIVHLPDDTFVFCLDRGWGDEIHLRGHQRDGVARLTGESKPRTSEEQS